ncbi:MAG: pyridoxal phosphate-dependent aminotransferase [Rhodospirillales bacterium]|nr:pyridoxal phosphate-dependent aminotransferase [Rhodospirillales bacterium]
MNTLSTILDRFQPSAISVIFSTTSRLKEEGHDIIDLGIGEPDFPTPDHVKQAAIDAINADFTRYTPVDGISALKSAISNKFQRDNDLTYANDQIVVDAGAKPLLFHAMQAMLNPNDEVILPVPCWTSYTGMVLLAGAKPVTVPCPQDKQFKLQASDLEGAITEKTRLILLNSPSNPTGAAYSHDEMKALTDVLIRHPNIWIIADDIYEHIVFDNFVFATPASVEPGLYDRTLTINGVSKAYSMPGWRIGFAIGNSKMIEALARNKSYLDYGAFTPIQVAATAALNGPQDCVDEIRTRYRERRDVLIDGLAAAGWDMPRPNATMFAWAPIPPQFKHLGSLEFSKLLLSEAKVAVAPGVGFGEHGDDHVRLALVENRQRTRQAIRSIKAFFNRYGEA